MPEIPARNYSTKKVKLFAGE
jgi:hypothetical protein